MVRLYGHTFNNWEILSDHLTDSKCGIEMGSAYRAKSNKDQNSTEPNCNDIDVFGRQYSFEISWRDFSRVKYSSSRITCECWEEEEKATEPFEAYGYKIVMMQNIVYTISESIE